MTKNVLVVDDSLVMRKVIRRMLRECGFSCSMVEADDGLEALARLAEHTFDLILCDWNMPAMNGLKFVQTVRGDAGGQTVPIVMITSQTNSELVAQAIEAGIQNYLIKPFTPELLRSKVGKYLEEDDPIAEFPASDPLDA